MREIVVDVDERFGKEYAGRYVFQALTWAKKSRIIQKYTRYHPRTGEVLQVDYTGMQAELVWASLKQQPEHKPITLEKLLSEDPEKGIPYELGELFGQAVNRLSGLTVDETAFLSARLDASSPIPQLQPSGSAKSSDGLQGNSPSSQPKPSNSSSSSSTS